jgi:hypothetical protein
MDLETFLTAVYCLTDDLLQDLLHGARLRQRGPQPVLADSEVLAMELAGEYLGYETDQGIYRYFRAHHRALFPRLARVHRTTFLRQAANLWRVKRVLWGALAQRAAPQGFLSVVDSFPVPVCRFARAKRARVLKELASWGFDAVSRHAYWGLRVHLRISWPGVITSLEVASANASELALAPEILAGARGWALGDRGYWSPALQRELGATSGVALLAPFRTRAHETAPWPFWLQLKRRRVETVIGQLIERFHGKRNWARDRWHLTTRWLRKVLSHTVAVLLCQQQGLPPLQLNQLVH